MAIYCQKCRLPLKLDGSLQNLNPAAYDLLVGSYILVISVSLLLDLQVYNVERVLMLNVCHSFFITTYPFKDGEFSGNAAPRKAAENLL